MARPLRIEFAGAVYHVTSRGNERKDIFRTDSDRRLFLDILQQVNVKYNWHCHAYCLMDNHYHIVIETPDGNLIKGMRQLNGVYTQAFNKRHDRVGHIFQGRYKAILIQKDSHLLEVCRYVVLNPVRALVVKRPETWQWSSYNPMIDKSSVHPCLTTEWVLGQFGRKKTTALKNYAEFVEAGIGKDTLWKQVKGQLLLGEEDFADKLIDMDKSGDIHEISRNQRHLRRPSLGNLFEEIKPRDRGERNEFIVEAVYKHAYSQREVADFLKLHYSTVSVVVKRKA